jgi:TetR/AcrR family transcriptional repressor of mexJK operon
MCLLGKKMKIDQIQEHENASRILEEGWNLFKLKGYRGVTMDELCAKCEITKPTLYYYFEDKENLFVQILQFKLQGFHKVIEQQGSSRERLNRTAKIILDSFLTEYGALIRDREHINRTENQLGIRNAFHNEMFGPLNSLMQNGIDNGELNSGDPHQFTLIFLGVINNFIGKSEELGIANEVLAQILTDYFLNGVSKK